MKLLQADLDYLAGLTSDSVEASRVRPGQKFGPHPANSTEMTLIRPGGRECYPAVWTQDFSMALLSGFVTQDEAISHLKLIAGCQNGDDERILENDSFIPAHAIPDHILFDGSPVFFPGTYSSGNDQGGEPFGTCPPVNNHYDFILIAHSILHNGGSPSLLDEIVNGATLLQRLRWAFDEPVHDPETELVVLTEQHRAVGFIFCDSIYMTGKHLVASLLRRRAALQLAEFERLAGDADRAASLEKVASTIAANIAPTFVDSPRLGGWLMAATEVGNQADVWGTIFALNSQVLPEDVHAAALKEIVKAINEGTILCRGAVRHVPTNRNASATSAWERACMPFNRYQNGAY